MATYHFHMRVSPGIFLFTSYPLVTVLSTLCVGDSDLMPLQHVAGQDPIMFLLINPTCNLHFPFSQDSKVARSLENTPGVLTGIAWHSETNLGSIDLVRLLRLPAYNSTLPSAQSLFCLWDFLDLLKEPA